MGEGAVTLKQNNEFESLYIYIYIYIYMYVYIYIFIRKGKEYQNLSTIKQHLFNNKT